MGAVLMENRYHDDEAMCAYMREYDETYQEYLRQRGVKEPQIAAGWVLQMAKYHSRPRRSDLASYFTSKGAVLD